MKVTAIVPSYKPDEKLAGVLRDLAAAGFERIIVVDDGSGPEYETYFRQAEGYPQCVLLRHEVNRGKGGALKTAFAWFLEHTGEDLGVVTVDGDGQHDPKFLEMMLTYLEKENADMVIGSRFITKEGFQSSGLRRVGIRYFTWLIHLLTGKTITDPTSGLRMVNRSVIQQYASCYPKDYPEPESVVTILKEEKKVKEVPVIMRERAGGVSSISPMKSIYYMIKVTLAILIEKIR